MLKLCVFLVGIIPLLGRAQVQKLVKTNELRLDAMIQDMEKTFLEDTPNQSSENPTSLFVFSNRE